MGKKKILKCKTAQYRQYQVMSPQTLKKAEKKTG